MNNKAYKWVIIILCFLILIIINMKSTKQEKVYVNDISYNTIDSLNNVISNLETYIIKQEKFIDSLKVVKDKIIIRYEKDIKDFSNVYVISDDSISRYIRERIKDI